jgi:hypothetical protein
MQQANNLSNADIGQPNGNGVLAVPKRKLPSIEELYENKAHQTKRPRYRRSLFRAC